jgi:CHAT domain-containing protein
MKLKKVMPTFLFLFILTFNINSYACEKSRLTESFNVGNSIKAKETIKSCIDQNENIDKADAIIAILLLDLLVDKTQYLKTWHTYWEALSKEVNKINIKDDKFLYSYLADYYQSFYLISIGLIKDKNAINNTINEEFDKIHSMQFDGSAALKATSRAFVAAAIGNYEVAQIHLNRARILVLTQDFKRIDAQIILSFYLYVSQYYLNENKDIRIFTKTYIEDKSELENIKKIISPLPLLHILKNAYDLSWIDPDVQENIANEIVNLNKNIIVPTINSFTHNLEDTQANELLKKYLKANINKEDLSKNDLLNKSNLQNLLSQGFKFYIQLSQNENTSTIEIDEFIQNVEKAKLKVGNLPMIVKAEASSFILQSLKMRKINNIKEELFLLEKYVKQRHLSLSFEKIKPGSKLPLNNSVELNVDLLVLKRLTELVPNEKYTADLAILCILQSNASSNSEEIYASFLNLSTKNQLQKIQTDKFLSIYADYESKIYNLYKNIFKTFDQTYNSTDSLKVKAETLFINGKYLNSFSLFRNQLRNFDDQSFKYYIVSDQLRKFVERDSSIQLFGLVNDFGIYVNVDDNQTNVRFINHADVKELKSLTNKILNFKNNKNERQEAIRKFSLLVFGNLRMNYKKISFITGPTILGIPVTNLSNNNNIWLIDTAIINSYINHINIINTSDGRYSHHKFEFLGIGNPSFRSKNELASIRETELLIRGKLSEDFSQIPELPETEIELKTFLSNLKNDGFLLVGDNATKMNLFNHKLSDYRIVNFATHGVLGGEIKGVLSPSLLLTKTNSDNGLLSISEILSMDGSPSITILSACNTGSNDLFIKHTDITNLSSAFYIKGSSAIIASYWAVDSIATQKLMSNLAEEIKNNKNGKLSYYFKNAINKLKSDKLYEDPIYWAAFSLIGDYYFGSEIEKPSSFEINFSKYHDSVFFKDSFFVVGSQEKFNDYLFEFSTNTNKLITQHKLINNSEILFSQFIKGDNLNFITVTKNELQINEIDQKSNSFKSVCQIKLSSSVNYDFLNFTKIGEDFIGISRISNSIFAINKIKNDCSVSSRKINFLEDGNFTGSILLKNGNFLEIGVTKSDLSEKTSKMIDAGSSELNTPISCRFTEITTFMQISPFDLSIIRQNSHPDVIIPGREVLNSDGSISLLKRHPCKDSMLAISFKLNDLSDPSTKYLTPQVIYNNQFKNKDLKVINFEVIRWWYKGNNKELILGSPLSKHYLRGTKSGIKSSDISSDNLSLFEFDSSKKTTKSSINSYSCSNFYSINKKNDRTAIVCKESKLTLQDSFRINLFN